jgi:hypothetical protein
MSVYTPSVFTPLSTQEAADVYATKYYVNHLGLSSGTGPTGAAGPGIPAGSSYGDYLYWNGTGAFAVGDATVQIGQAAGQQATAGTNSGSVSIGASAGGAGQGLSAIAIGQGAGASNQGGRSIAIGTQAGLSGLGSQSIVIGGTAGGSAAGGNQVIIGASAGSTSPNSNTVSIGAYAGSNSPGEYSVVLGAGAGQGSVTDNSIMIGQSAGQSTGNGIILNSSGNPLSGNSSRQGFYVSAVSSQANTPTPLYYNAATSEITSGTTGPSPSPATQTSPTGIYYSGSPTTLAVQGTATQVLVQSFTFPGASSQQYTLNVAYNINVSVVTATAQLYAFVTDTTSAYGAPAGQTLQASSTNYYQLAGNGLLNTYSGLSSVGPHIYTGGQTTLVSLRLWTSAPSEYLITIGPGEALAGTIYTQQSGLQVWCLPV